MGTFLLIVCGAFAVALAWSFLTALLWGTPPVGFKEVMGSAIAVATFFEVNRRRRVGRELQARPFRLSPSFNSGLLGGFVGGALAGLFVGASYYVQFRSSDPSVTLATIAEVFVFSSISGLVLGSTIQLAIAWFRHLVAEHRYPLAAFNDVTAGLIGGIIGGTFPGLAAMLFFGPRYDEFVGVVPLVTATVFGVIFVAAGALFYDYGGRWQNVLRAFMISLLIVGCVATAGIAFLLQMDAEKLIYGSSALQGGAFLGAVIGGAAGAQVGLTFCLYRVSDVPEQP